MRRVSASGAGVEGLRKTREGCCAEWLWVRELLRARRMEGLFGVRVERGIDPTTRTAPQNGSYDSDEGMSPMGVAPPVGLWLF